ncbi:hypothetical protein KFF47_25800, partial [Pseudomonas fluorescens]|nr:hypothetical protein [Pseudomonas fluorescens]
MVQAFLQHLVEEGRRRILRIKISPCENVLHHTKNAETLCIDFPERHADSDFCHESVGSSLSKTFRAGRLFVTGERGVLYRTC